MKRNLLILFALFPVYFLNAQPRVTWLKGAGSSSFSSVTSRWFEPETGDRYDLESNYLMYKPSLDTSRFRVKDFWIQSFGTGVVHAGGLAVAGNFTLFNPVTFSPFEAPFFRINNDKADTTYYGSANGSIQGFLVIGNDLLAFGDFSKIGGQPLPGLGLFSQATNKWSVIPELQGFTITAGIIYQQAVVLAGNTGAATGSKIYRWENGTVTDISGNIAEARVSHLASTNGRLYAFGNIQIQQNSLPSLAVELDGTTWRTVELPFETIQHVSSTGVGKVWLAGASARETITGFIENGRFSTIGKGSGRVLQISVSTNGNSAFFAGKDLVLNNRIFLEPTQFEAGIWQITSKHPAYFPAVDDIKTGRNQFLVTTFGSGYPEYGFTDSTLKFRPIPYEKFGYAKWIAHPERTFLKTYSPYTSTEIILEVDANRITPFLDPARFNLESVNFDGAFSPSGSFLFVIPPLSFSSTQGIFSFENGAITRLVEYPPVSENMLSLLYNDASNKIFVLKNNLFVAGDAAFSSTFGSGQWLFGRVTGNSIIRYNRPAFFAPVQYYRKTVVFPFGTKVLVGEFSESGFESREYNFALLNPETSVFTALPIESAKQPGGIIRDVIEVGDFQFVYGVFSKLGNTETANAALIVGDSIHAVTGFENLNFYKVAVLPNGDLLASTQFSSGATTSNGISGSTFLGKLTGIPTAPKMEPKETPPTDVKITAYPNPFNPETQVQLELLKDGFLELDVFDLTGRKLQTLAKGNFPAGKNTFRLNGQTLPSGVYLIIANQDGKRTTQKITLVR